MPKQVNKKEVNETAQQWADFAAAAAHHEKCSAADPDCELKVTLLAKSKYEFLRNALVIKYRHLVKYTAERIHQKLPNEVQLDDLISSGTFGLIDAINAFDLSRGIKFETYCPPRIRGAILDEIRNMDWVPRLVRSRSTQVSAARSQLQSELGRDPTDQEVMRKLKIKKADYDKILGDSQVTGLVSLSRKWFETDSFKDVEEIDMHIDKKGTDPAKETQRHDLKDLLTRGLSRAERLIIVLYYFEEMTMKEIGKALDLSESRVSQMHSSIILRLRAAFSDRNLDDK